MPQISTRIAAALAAALIATASFAGIVHVPQADGQFIASTPGATLA